MTLPWPHHSKTHAKRVATLCACVLLAGCVGLPGPDGFEASLIENAATLAVLTPANGDDVKSVSRNGLLLSPAVRESASRVSASADEVRVQRAALFPGLSLAAGSGISSSSSSGTHAVELSGTQLLLDGGNSRRAVEVADFDLQISYTAFQKAVDDAVVELLKASDDVQTQRELLEVYRKQHHALRDLETLVAARTESGAVSSSDLLEARKRLQSAAFLVNDTELTLAEAQDRLMLLSGQTKGGRHQISPDSCKAQGETDDLRMAHLELGRAQVALERAEKAVSPRVSLKPVLGGEIGVNKFPLGVNVDVRSDLLQGGALTARANVARSHLAAAEAKLGVVRLEDHVAENGLVRSLAAGDRKSTMLRRQIELLSQTRELYRSQYADMGTRRLSELLDNEEEYYSRQAELVELRSQLAGTRLDCAVRSRVLRRELALDGNSIYGFPLAPDRF